jgi:hypothetical protein
MDFYGISMISTDFQRFLCISVDFYGISMDFYGISMDFYGFLQISMDLNRIFHEFRLVGDPILVDFKEKKHHAGWEIIVSSSQSTFSPVRIMISHQNSMISKF